MERSLQTATWVLQLVNNMAIQLRQLQQYRNTILLIAGLSILALIAAASTLIKEVNKNALNPETLPPTAPMFGSVDPQSTRINWQEIKIGDTIENITALLGNPEKIEDQANQKIAYYKTESLIKFHTITYSDNKSVKISRFVNERIERISPRTYQSNYGKPTTLRQGQGLITQIDSFKVNSNQYVILVWDTQYDQTYEIINLTKSEYEKYVNNLPPIEEGIHLEVEPDM